MSTGAPRVTNHRARKIEMTVLQIHVFACDRVFFWRVDVPVAGEGGPLLDPVKPGHDQTGTVLLSANNIILHSVLCQERDINYFCECGLKKTLSAASDCR